MKYVFVHGLGQDSSSWENTISFMGETTRISHPDVFDLLKDNKTTYNNLYLAFTEYMEEYSEPATLLGLSLGAVLALNYTIDHPKRVRSLILLAPQYKMPKLILKVQNIIFRFMPESLFQKLGSSKHDFIQLTKSMMELDFSKDLTKVQCSTLVLCGEKDRANKRAAKKLAAQIPTAEMRTVRGAGHEINVEAPEQLASILNEFFLNIGSPNG
ncbi:2-succinyl-6-hydroxy-2,4-cyclohexadiene-1-carboxylate synthase [Lysinibacillus contaminans]|uniref:2-succinyl-6-hydroxy-2, 4-cyclohexadiene-1-carboxylate synthase n=1 Tax=Lysinibacillus contaminans TaxID=1293441 RepID=A0ABR5K5J7_9BACI|nr:alpha/beta hydrolase [Lysinibacillus contaminans]KOS71506.1 2-succinyl-6-hydroxy-2,4-cyclohexadiene-1-carboxylate synthase [Lysinibacillus contaminans]